MHGEDGQSVVDQIGNINIFNQAGLRTVSDNLITNQSQSQLEVISGKKVASKNQSSDAKIMLSDGRKNDIKKI